MTHSSFTGVDKPPSSAHAAGLLASVYERYRSHHGMSGPLLEFIGAVGCASFPLFYFFRIASAVPQAYDDGVVRAVATFMCALLAVRRQWPARLKRCKRSFESISTIDMMPKKIAQRTIKLRRPQKIFECLIG